jgi:hypothetical protein
MAIGAIIYYTEKDGTHARRITKPQVQAALQHLPDVHGHYAEGITRRACVGRFYWPSRFPDIIAYCGSCNNCQAVGPLRPSVGLMPVMELMPWDLTGLDYISPISPVSIMGNRYILIAVDYAT